MKAILIASLLSLKPFTTDLCTGFPEGKWGHCCIVHDLFFWAGGTKSERDLADQDLRTCVAETGEERVAHLMYAGIRAGYRSPFKIPGMHWGNGWSDEVRRHPLTLEELEMIEDQLDHDSSIPPEIKSEFLHTLRSR